MKTASLIAAVLLLVCWLAQYIYSRRYKREFDVFYQRYTQQGHFFPAHVAIADGLGMPGTSLKAQWFLWILKRKKIKIRDQVWLDAKTYDFVQKTATPERQKWLAMDFILLLVEAIITTVGCIFIYLIKHQG